MPQKALKAILVELKEAVVPQRLKQREKAYFLRWLFSELASRPKPLEIAECARAARYLMYLSSAGVPKSATDQPEAFRYSSDRLAGIIWDQALRWSNSNIATADEVLRFLDKHSASLRHNPYFEETRTFVKTFEVKPNSAAPHRFGQARLVNSQLVQDAPPKMHDDLSERIFGAFYAIKQSGFSKVAATIATSLNEAGIKKKRPTDVDDWGESEVRERIKSHKERLKARWEKGLLSTPAVQKQKKLKELLQRNLTLMANRWIVAFIGHARKEIKVVKPA